MSRNPAAIHLLEKNPDKIEWDWLCINPAIFEPDQQKHPWTRMEKGMDF
jgi:hypothetical protein